MDTQKADLFLLINGKYFESRHISHIRQHIQEVSENKWYKLQATQLHNPTLSLIVSIIGGQLGIDRFMIGDVGMGIGKLLTCGGGGIWTIIDWFIISNRVREKNLSKLEDIFFEVEQPRVRDTSMVPDYGRKDEYTQSTFTHKPSDSDDFKPKPDSDNIKEDNDKTQNTKLKDDTSTDGNE